MYDYVRHLNFPKVPIELFNKLPTDLSGYKFNIVNNSYKRTSSFVDPIKKWCDTNICQGINWNLQFIDSDLPAHVDTHISAKFIYIYEPGGQNVYTNFWSSDKSKKLNEICLDALQWYILKVDIPHSVTGIESGMVRKAITGWIF